MPGLRLSSEVLEAADGGTWARLLRSVEWVARRFGRVPERLPIHRLGQRGEDIAYWTLRQHGYTIVARNYRRNAGEAAPRGEIDLIGFEGQPPTLVFIEVKTRTTAGHFAAEDAVDQEKRRHLIRLARAYRRRRHYQGPYRFDVVIIHAAEGATPAVKLHRDAFRES